MIRQYRKSLQFNLSLKTSKTCLDGSQRKMEFVLPKAFTGTCPPNTSSISHHMAPEVFSLRLITFCSERGKRRISRHSSRHSPRDWSGGHLQLWKEQSGTRFTLTITAQPVAKWKMMLISSSTASFYGLSGSHSTLPSELITSPLNTMESSSFFRILFHLICLISYLAKY